MGYRLLRVFSHGDLGNFIVRFIRLRSLFFGEQTGHKRRVGNRMRGRWTCDKQEDTNENKLYRDQGPTRMQTQTR